MVEDGSLGQTQGRFWSRVGAWGRRHATTVYAGQLGAILLLILMAPYIVIEIPAGHAGVLWLRFLGGTVTDRDYGEGVHFIFPWDEMVLYDARLQSSARVYDTISSDGLGMQVEIAVRYRVNHESLGLLHKQIGPSYPEILVYPEIGSYARELIANYRPEQLYSGTRAFIQAQILERMATGSVRGNQGLRSRLVDVEDVLIRSVELPHRVQDAIERKVEQHQAMLEYDFRIARERKESERKRTEAEGVRDFQAAVARTITPEYLRLRGIEATTALATSRNSKVIVIGGRDGLPVMNPEDAPAATAGIGAGQPVPRRLALPREHGQNPASQSGHE